jgi:hypothetical protein
MSVTTKFCFYSKNAEQNTTLRLYKPTKTYDTKQFDSSSSFDPDPRFISGVKYQDYESIANKTFCDSSLIKGQSITDNEESAFVFYNLGTSQVFLNLTTTVKTPSYRPSLAIRTCRNLSYCDELPSSIKYLIVSKNINTPCPPYWSENDIIFKCVYKIPAVLNSIIFVGILFLGFLLLYLTIKRFSKKCGPRLQKWYFGREIVRIKLGEAAAQMLDDSQDLDELYKIIKKERETKEFNI